MSTTLLLVRVILCDICTVSGVQPNRVYISRRNSQRAMLNGTITKDSFSEMKYMSLCGGIIPLITL